MVAKRTQLCCTQQSLVKFSEIFSSFGRGFNLKDGRPSNELLTYYVTDDKDFMHFEPQNPQYKKLKNGEFTSLNLRITDESNNVITDGPQVTVVLHIRNRKI